MMIPPSILTAGRTAGTIAIQAAPGLAVLGIGLGAVKLMEPKVSNWEKGRIAVKEASEVVQSMKIIADFFSVFFGKSKTDKAQMSEAEFNAAVKTAAADLVAAETRFNERVAAAVAAEKAVLSAQEQQNVSEAVAEAIAAYEAKLEKKAADEAKLAEKSAKAAKAAERLASPAPEIGGAKVTRKPQVRKAAGG
jgi:hypothetical protein